MTVAVKSRTPHKVVTGTKPSLSKLPEWGCRVWVHTKANVKLDECAVEGRWVGYDQQSKRSRIYWPEKRSATVARLIIFAPMVKVDDLTSDKLPNEKLLY